MVVGIVLATIFIIYLLWTGAIERLAGLALMPALYFAMRLYQELRLEMPDYPDSIDELAHMLANHLQGTVKSTPGRD